MFPSILTVFHERPLLKTLVVEDDPFLSNALERVIRAMAGRDALLDIDWFTSAKDGKAALATRAYDLVIADYCLPAGETGAEVILHAQAMTYSPYCLMMSGLPHAEISQRMKECGINAPLLHKPFTVTSMTQILEKTIREKIADKKAGCI